MAEPGFPRRTATPQFGPKTYYLTIFFCQKLHENERNWTKGGRVPDAPGSAKGVQDLGLSGVPVEVGHAADPFTYWVTASGSSASSETCAVEIIVVGIALTVIATRVWCARVCI